MACAVERGIQIERHFQNSTLGCKPQTIQFSGFNSKTLARAGLKQSYKDTFVCDVCKIEIGLDQIKEFGNSPFQAHQTLSPNCEYLKNYTTQVYRDKYTVVHKQQNDVENPKDIYFVSDFNIWEDTAIVKCAKGLYEEKDVTKALDILKAKSVSLTRDNLTEVIHYILFGLKQKKSVHFQLNHDTKISATSNNIRFNEDTDDIYLPSITPTDISKGARPKTRTQTELISTKLKQNDKAVAHIHKIPEKPPQIVESETYSETNSESLDESLSLTDPLLNGVHTPGTATNGHAEADSDIETDFLDPIPALPHRTHVPDLCKLKTHRTEDDTSGYETLCEPQTDSGISITSSNGGAKACTVAEQSQCSIPLKTAAIYEPDTQLCATNKPTEKKKKKKKRKPKNKSPNPPKVLESPASCDKADPELRREYEALFTNQRCNSCWKNCANTLNLPCRHLNACESCSEGQQYCTHCGDEIIGTVKVYFS